MRSSAGKISRAGVEWHQFPGPPMRGSGLGTSLCFHPTVAQTGHAAVAAKRASLGLDLCPKAPVPCGAFLWCRAPGPRLLGASQAITLVEAKHRCRSLDSKRLTENVGVADGSWMRDGEPLFRRPFWHPTTRRLETPRHHIRATERAGRSGPSVLRATCRR